jgi:tetraacyldisaccharide 4'-kinase
MGLIFSGNGDDCRFLHFDGNSGLSAARSQLESVLTRNWHQRGLLAWLLSPIAFVFLGLTALRRTLYRAGLLRSVALPVPVIVVGNIFVGGTGKTPFTIWLCEILRQGGYRPGVISRGYGSSHDMPLPVTPDSTAQRVGDEPVLIACSAQVPVVVGRNRVAAAQALLQAHPDVNVIVSDDGLQHYALQRDIEIVLFDTRGTGNGWLLPAGPLRESASRKRDFTVINGLINEHRNGDDAHDAFGMQLTGQYAEQLSDRSRRVALHALNDAAANGGKPLKIVAAAGIGNPQRYFSMLRDVGLAFDELPLPDHYNFAENPFAGLAADIILITEKDAVKCRQIDTFKHDPRLWVVPVSARIDTALATQILEKLRGHSTA